MAAAQPKKILYVGNHAGHFITHRIPIFRALQQAGYEVHVALPSHTDQLEKLMTQNIDLVEKINQLGFHYHQITLDRSSVNPLREIQALTSLYNLFRELKPDLVFNATIKPIIYGGIISRLARIPATVNLVSGLGYIFLADGAKGRVLRTFATLAYKAAIGRPNTHTIFQNSDDYQVFIDHNIVTEKTASIVKGSGVNIDEFSFVPEPAGTPVVILTSRLLWDKGIGEYVKASQQLRDEGVEARFLLVGDTDEANPNAIPQDQLQKWNDDGLVEWLGWRQDVPDLLKQSHIVCLPSYYREGIPKSLIEAAACGRPIVTTDSPGCREIVENGKNGFLVKPRDVQDLSDALRKLLTDAELRREMGQNSRTLAETGFSEQAIGARATEICTKLIDNIK